MLNKKLNHFTAIAPFLSEPALNELEGFLTPNAGGLFLGVAPSALREIFEGIGLKNLTIKADPLNGIYNPPFEIKFDDIPAKVYPASAGSFNVQILPGVGAKLTPIYSAPLGLNEPIYLGL